MCISITIKFQLCEKLLIPITTSINWYCISQLLISITVIEISLIYSEFPIVVPHKLSF